ncbi:MAG: ATP-binding protein [Thermodesulfobacteriota bacterium]
MPGDSNRLTFPAFPGGLRSRLILLVLSSILPAFGLIVQASLELRRHAAEEVQHDFRLRVRLVANERKSVIQAGKQILTTLSQIPAVRHGHLAETEAIFANLLAQYPQYTSFSLISREGEVLASPALQDRQFNVAHKPYFIRVMTERSLVVGSYQIGLLTGQPSIPLVNPILDGDGRVSHLLYCALGLRWFNELLSESSRRGHDTITMIDDRGFVIARHPDPERWVGRAEPEAEIIRIVLSRGEGTAVVRGMDRVRRFYAFTRLDDASGSGYVYSGISLDNVYAEADRVLVRNLCWLGIAAALALAGAWGLGHLFVLRGVNVLVRTAEKITTGDLSVRTSWTGGGEIGSLARTFDQMAASLERREAERLATEEVLRRNAARGQLLAEVTEAFLAAGPAYLAALDTVARRATELIGDLCVIRLKSDDGRWIEPAVVYHDDPRQLEFLRRLLSSIPQGAVEEMVGAVARTGEPLFMPEASTMDLISLMPPEYQPLLDQFGLRSLVVVALRAERRVLGTLTMWRDRAGDPYTSEDLALLQHIADRAALAIAYARLYEDLRKLNAELERRVLQRTAQLEAANKEMEAFAYSVSHDLRAPLRAIDGFSRIVAQRYGPLLDEKGKDYLDRVVSEGRRMAQLIDDLLKLSRLSRTEMTMTRVDLSGLAWEAATRLRRSEPDRRVTFQISDALAAEGDEALLRVALENLFGNAWKFTRNNPQARIEFSAAEEDDLRSFCVRDNGAGFDMAYADKLFGAFQRLHNSSEFPGSGIGLAIVQRVIHRHGGRIWARGAVGQGAAFYFTLDSGGGP